MFYGGLGALNALGSMVVMRCDTRIYTICFSSSLLLLIKSAWVNRLTIFISSYPILLSSSSNGAYSAGVAGVVSRPGNADALPCWPERIYEQHASGLRCPVNSGNSAITSPLLNLRKIVLFSFRFRISDKQGDQCLVSCQNRQSDNERQLKACRASR